MKVYAVTGKVSINNEFVEKTWLAFYTLTPFVENHMKFLGGSDAAFPIQYPLTLDNGLIINQDDYYRKTEE